MSNNEERETSSLRLRHGGANVQSLGGRLIPFVNRILPSSVRMTRRQLRRWLRAHGLTIVVVFAMMIVAWLIADR